MKMKICPHCQEKIKIKAKKCSHCRSDLRIWFIRHPIITALLIMMIISSMFSMCSSRGYETDTYENNESDYSDSYGSTSSLLPDSPGSLGDTTVYTMAKSLVRDHLKSPSTANFPWFDYEVIGGYGDIWKVESYVDAQNSFGATVRTYYTVKIKFNGGDWADKYNWDLLLIEME